MEIILMRHGKPTYTGSPKVTCDEMADWIAQYNLSDTGDDMPPGSSELMTSKASLIISSTLPRALSSLRAIGYEPDIIDNVFRELTENSCEDDFPVRTPNSANFQQNYQALLTRLRYLTKVESKVFGEGGRNFGCSQIEL